MTRSAVLAVIVCGPALAHAEPAPALRLDIGAGSAIGEVGVVYSRPTTEYTFVELGAGIGVSGLSLSAMGKLRFGSNHLAFTTGLGLSSSLPVLGMNTVNQGHPDGDQEMRGPGAAMAWLDLDIAGIEARTSTGWVFASSGGLTCALTEAHWDVIDLGGDIHRGDCSPQFRVGVGKTF